MSSEDFSGPVSELVVMTLQLSVCKIQGKTYAVLPIEDYENLLTKAQLRSGQELPRDVVAHMLDGKSSLVRAWRKHLRLTQREVAQRMGVSKGTYSRIETSKNSRPSTLHRVAAALDLGPELIDALRALPPPAPTAQRARSQAARPQPLPPR